MIISNGFKYKQEKHQENDTKSRIEKLDNIAKIHLKPHFKSGKIDKEKYKSIMKSVVKYVSLLFFIIEN